MRYLPTVPNKWNFSVPRSHPPVKQKWSCISVNYLTYILLLVNSPLAYVAPSIPLPLLMMSPHIYSWKSPKNALYEITKQSIGYPNQEVSAMFFCFISNPYAMCTLPVKPWTYLMDVIGLIKALSSSAYVKVTKRCWFQCRNKREDLLTPCHSLLFGT